jgi:hypothetical protein
VVDVTHADSPDAPPGRTFPLRGGTMVGVGPSLHSHFSDALLRLARDLGVRSGAEVMGGGNGTNAWAVAMAREGIPCALLSVPLRYMHTPLELVHPDDLEATARLPPPSRKDSKRRAFPAEKAKAPRRFKPPLPGGTCSPRRPHSWAEPSLRERHRKRSAFPLGPSGWNHVPPGGPLLFGWERRGQGVGTAAPERRGAVLFLKERGVLYEAAQSASDRAD